METWQPSDDIVLKENLQALLEARPAVEKGLPVYSRSCACASCNPDECDEDCVECGGNQKADYCKRFEKVIDHVKEVSLLLAGLKCPEIISLIVGPERKVFMCHKALLGFKSEFFDAACYGQFASSVSNEVQLPEDDAEAISVFVSWLYTGIIPRTCTVAPEVLWVLGDKLRSPAFANEAMHYLFVEHYDEYLPASVAEYVYNNTSSSKSILRCYVKDLVITEGPLHDDYRGDHEEWEDLIRRGGHLVVEVSLQGSFHQYVKEVKEKPYYWGNQYKYLMSAKPHRPIEDFLEGKQREESLSSYRGMSRVVTHIDEWDHVGGEVCFDAGH